MAQPYTAFPRQSGSFSSAGGSHSAFGRSEMPPPPPRAPGTRSFAQQVQHHGWMPKQEPKAILAQPSSWSPLLGSSSSSSMSSDRAPKDFAKPLTCFYWAHKGFCNKTDSECLYAHHMTGVIAEPPQRVAGGPAVAGKNAESALAAARDQARILEENKGLELILKHRQSAIEQAYVPLQQSVAAVTGASENLGALINDTRHSLHLIASNEDKVQFATIIATAQALLSDLELFENEVFRIKHIMHEQIRASLQSSSGAGMLHAATGADQPTRAAGYHI